MYCDFLPSACRFARCEETHQHSYEGRGMMRNTVTVEQAKKENAACIFLFPHPSNRFQPADRNTTNVKTIYFKTRVWGNIFFLLYFSLTDGKGRLRGFVTHINKGLKKC